MIISHSPDNASPEKIHNFRMSVIEQADSINVLMTFTESLIPGADKESLAAMQKMLANWKFCLTVCQLQLAAN